MISEKTLWKCKEYEIVSEIHLYNINLKKPGFKIAPIYPTCKKCGEPVVLMKGNQKYTNSILVLTGPCGSGKTSIAEHLYQTEGFNAVDLDCLIDLGKH